MFFLNFLVLSMKKIFDNELYEILIGVIDILIFCLTLRNIEAFNNKVMDKTKITGRSNLFVQVVLSTFSLFFQATGIIARGFLETKNDFLKMFDFIMTLLSFLIGKDKKILHPSQKNHKKDKMKKIIKVFKPFQNSKYLSFFRHAADVPDQLHPSSNLHLHILRLQMLLRCHSRKDPLGYQVPQKTQGAQNRDRRPL